MDVFEVLFLTKDNFKKPLPKKMPKMLANPTFCGQEHFNVEGDLFFPYREIKYYMLVIFFLSLAKIILNVAN